MSNAIVKPCGVTSVTFIVLNEAVGCLRVSLAQARERKISGTRAAKILMRRIISHFRSDDGGFERELAVDHAVDHAANAMMPFPLLLPDEVESLPRRNLHAELGVLHPAEADEPFPADEAAGVKAG